MTEQISALMDGELSDDEGARQIDFLGTNIEYRETWARYAMIGDVLRGRVHPGCAPRVATRLAGEPTILAPQPRRLEHQRKRWFAVSAAAVAAGVAFVGWIAVATLDGTQPAQLAGGKQSPDAEVAAASVPAGDSANVGNYIMAHQQFSPSNAMQGVAPYVRLVSEDREGAGR